MDAVILTGVGAAALGYVAYVVWRGISGKAACACNSPCREAGRSCRCSAKNQSK